MEKILEEKEAKTYGRFQWFLYVVVIPLLFAVTCALIVMTVAGINIFKAAKEQGEKIPFVSDWFKEEKTKTVKNLEESLITLEGQIKDREAKIQQLEVKIGDKDKEVEKIKLEKERLEQEIEELNAIQEENKRAFKDIVRTYETITPKKAAPIITKMGDEEALKILSNIKADKLAAIMEKMAPEEAAKFTKLLTAESQNAEPNRP